MHGRISIGLSAYPPDKRKRDLDNLCKVSIDSLQKAGLFDNDSQIDYLSIERCNPIPDGKMMVWIREL